MFFVIVIVAVVGYIAGRKRDEIIAFCKGLGGQIREKMNGSSDGDIQELLNQFISPGGKYYPAHLEVLKQKIREKPEYRSHAISYLGHSIDTLYTVADTAHTIYKRNSRSSKLYNNINNIGREFRACAQQKSQFIKDVVGNWMNCYDSAELDELLNNFRFSDLDLDNEVKGILMLIGYEIYAPFDIVHYVCCGIRCIFEPLDYRMDFIILGLYEKKREMFPKLVDDFFANLQREIDAGNFYPKCIDDFIEKYAQYRH